MAYIPVYIEGKLKAVIRRIEEAAAFDGVMDENFNDSTSLKTLVRLSGMSERSLREWFKIYTGLSISRYANKRRIEYAARIFRLFPETSKSEVSEFIGLNSSHALYPFMKRNGVVDIDGLRNYYNSADFSPLNFRFDYLPDCIMFYTLDKVHYDECSTVEFEMGHWNIIERYINERFPKATKIGDVGFAIDRYVENKPDGGIFISGIISENIAKSKLSDNMIGDIGWRKFIGHKYVVFTHKGDYKRLSDFYSSSLHTLLNRTDIQIEKSILIMEKYLNSPIDTPTEELITEIWIPIIS
ncbi:MAG: AraC family transcriptional regulator [Muribaculaceae bacterium]|nr:AraC family transcriptional regulator [Muribaculaceae bacterium]